MRDEKEYKHLSYAKLGFSRAQCSTGQSLYGSDIKHNTIIKMELKRSSHRRGLNTDWYYGDETIAIINMSQNQFSELITSMNMGDGIPVTLEYTKEDGRIDPPDFESKTEVFEEEFKDMTKRVGDDLVELQSTMKKLLSGSGTVKKSDREEMLNQVAGVVRNLISNMPYVEDCFKESMDKTITDAKGTIEAWYQHKVISAGIEALANENGGSVPELIEDKK